MDGAVLREWRRSRGWDVPETARRLRIAAGNGALPEPDSLRRMIWRWEREGLSTERYVLLYARAVGVSPDDLASGPVLAAQSQPNLADEAGGGGHRPTVITAVGGTIPVHPGASALMPDPDLYARITSALEDHSRVDRAIVSWLEKCLAEHRRVEDTIGSGPLLGVVASQLSAVARFARQAPTPLTDQVVNLAAQYAQFMAWLCGDQGNNAAALAWYDRAHDWAMESGDANMAATAVSMKAHRAWSVGDSPRCVRLGEAARWSDARTSPGVQGMAAQMIARGHAIGGDPDDARSAIDDAQALVSAAAERPEDEPPWMYFYDENWFTAQRGMIEADLAEQGRGQPHQAVALLERALDGLPETYRRDRAWYGTMLARAHVTAGDSGAAVGVGLTFAADAKALNRYATDELRRLSRSLRRRGARQASELSDALASAS